MGSSAAHYYLGRQNNIPCLYRQEFQMLLIAQIITTFLLLFWPLLFMLSPMAFDAPGSENNRSYVIGMMLFLCYPIPLCAAYWIMGGQLWGISGRTLTLITSVVIILALTLFGYGNLLKNALSGIASSGYSVADDQVFYNANLIENADAKSEQHTSELQSRE